MKKTLDNEAGEAYTGQIVKEKDMDTEDFILKSFNDSIGAVLTYLDESGAGFATKKAVKSELWELCDKKILPLIGEGLGNDTNETRGNC